MKYFAQFTPAITVEFNNKKYVMNSTKRYNSLQELFTSLAANASNIKGVKVGIWAENKNKTCTPWL